MTEEQKFQDGRERSQLADDVGSRAARKIRARKNGTQVWFGLGMMGLIGWSVVIPTLLGAALGHWMDGRHVAGRDWTLALMIAGLALGCLNAWRWVADEEKAMRNGGDGHD